MNHKDMLMLVSMYCDNELSQDKKLVVESHLNTCEECRQFAESIKLVRNEIKELTQLDLPQTFTSNVVHSIQQSDVQSEIWLNIEPSARNTFFAIAVSVVILFLLSSIFNSNRDAMEQSWSSITADSTATQVILQQDEITKNDLLYAVISK